jgi:ATP-binding cassette subfamily B protein
MTTAEPRVTSDVRLYLRLLREARPYWAHIAGLLALSLLSTPIALLQPLPLKLAVDSVIGTEPLPRILHAIVPGTTSDSTAALLLIAMLLVLVTLLSSGLDMASTVLKTYTGNRMTVAFRARLFRQLQRLSLTFHDSRGSADSLYRVLNDAPAVQNVAIDGVIPFVTSTFMLVTMSCVILRINWQIGLAALTVGPVIAVISHTYRRRLRPQHRVLKVAESRAQSVIQEVLQSVRVVKAFGQEAREEERYRSRADESVKMKMQLAASESWYGMLFAVTTSIGTALVLYVGAMQVRANVISLGDLVLIMGYLGQLYGPIERLGKRAATLALYLTSAERAFAVIDEPTDVAEKPDARPLVRAAGAVVFDDVTFGYESSRAPVLSSVKFDVPAGASVGIVGITGSGKTTLVNLLTRFYDPTSGRVLLDGVDARDYRVADLRNQFAIVLQEPVLFSTTVLENIAYGRPGASREEIVAAAQAANAHNFIERLPGGYDTLVGERGMRLSGGERQRISLARAFLRDAPILILDEPTSSVDLATEGLILDAMKRLMDGRTSFMIAHRPRTLEHCDFILTVTNGRIQFAPQASAFAADASPEYVPSSIRASARN